MRPVLGVAAGAAVASLGAVMLGEQPLQGATALVAGVLFGLAIAEVVVSVARYGDLYLAAAAAILTQAGFVWALYIETGHQLDAAAPEAWVGVVLGAAAAAAWLRTAARRGPRSRSPEARTPDG
ncbi:MAG TPA: hypothetical protein VM345_04205 [Acidimicrobiales bacterium]|nr:hypothetical protein [Acidimicrobiales bacterium]